MNSTSSRTRLHARQQKVALVGKRRGQDNAHIFMGLESSGGLTIGHNVDIGYYAEPAEELDGELTVFETSTK